MTPLVGGTPAEDSRWPFLPMLSTTRFCALCIRQPSRVVRSKPLLPSSFSFSEGHASMLHAGGRSPCEKRIFASKLATRRERPGSPLWIRRSRRWRSASRCAAPYAGFLRNRQPFSSTNHQRQPTSLPHSWNIPLGIRTYRNALAYIRTSQSGGRHNGCSRRWSPPFARETPLLCWPWSRVLLCKLPLLGTVRHS